jgi:hypothetical protein
MIPKTIKQQKKDYLLNKLIIIFENYKEKQNHHHVSNTKSLIFSPNSTISSQNSISCLQNFIESSQLPPIITGKI